MRGGVLATWVAVLVVLAVIWGAAGWAIHGLLTHNG